MSSSLTSTCQYLLLRSNFVKYLALASKCSVSSGLGMAYASLMVLLFNFLKSTQNLIVPSFFLTITTFEEYELLLGLIAPASSISSIRSWTSWNRAGGILRCGSLNGSLSARLIQYLNRSQFPKSVISVENMCFHFSRNLVISSFCLSSNADFDKSIPDGIVLSSFLSVFTLCWQHCAFQLSLFSSCVPTLFSLDANSRFLNTWTSWNSHKGVLGSIWTSLVETLTILTGTLWFFPFGSSLTTRDKHLSCLIPL